MSRFQSSELSLSNGNHCTTSLTMSLQSNILLGAVWASVHCFEKGKSFFPFVLLLSLSTIFQRHEACTLSGNCSSQECDISNNLQCMNDSHTNVTGSGWWYVLQILVLENFNRLKNVSFSNCTSLQWWNGTYCRDKGVPAWGNNASIICNATYQCADYNLVSCPLGGNWPTLNSTCECATTKYWVRTYRNLFQSISFISEWYHLS